MKFFIPITLLLLASTFAIHADRKKSLRSEMTGIDAFNVGTMTIKKGNTEHSISCLTFSTDEPVFSQFSKDSWYDRNFHGDNAFEFKTDPIYGLVFIENLILNVKKKSMITLSKTKKVNMFFHLNTSELIIQAIILLNCSYQNKKKQN